MALIAIGRWALGTTTAPSSRLRISHLTADYRQKGIDRTFVAEDTRWIIDYKTMPVPNTDNLTAIAARYKPQLAGYTALFAKENLPIKIAILFVSTGKLVEIE